MSKLIDEALDHGAQVKPHPKDSSIILITFTEEELEEFVLFIEGNNSDNYRI